MIEVTYVDHMGDDLSVVNAARVSFGKKSKLECIDMVKGKTTIKSIKNITSTISLSIPFDFVFPFVFLLSFVAITLLF